MTQGVSRDELPDSCDYWPVLPGESTSAQLVPAKSDCSEYLRFFCMLDEGHDLPHVAEAFTDTAVAVWDDNWYADVLGVAGAPGDVPA
jgi:hypothetical protein